MRKYRNKRKNQRPTLRLAIPKNTFDIQVRLFDKSFRAYLKQMNIKSNILETVGSTPLVRLSKINNTQAEILAKLEAFNPTGSVKDRAALAMIEQAEKDGKLADGGVIIEPTSGNTGIGLAMAAAVKGFKLIIVMPDTMSAERRKMMSALGAELILTPGAEGMKGAIKKANEIHAETPNSFIPQQFENPANAQAHFETTAPEIWRDTDGRVDIFVAGVGTGGTISGVAKFLKSKNPAVKIIAVEPEESAVLSGNPPASHKIQGIGAGFVPAIYEATLVDEIIKVNADDAGVAARNLAKSEGILAGISSGAALHAVLKIAALSENAGKRIVVILPDTGSRYLSTWLF